MTKQYEAFKEFFVDMFEIPEDQQDDSISYDPETKKVSCFPFMYIEPSVEEEFGSISFNEELPSSTLIDIAMKIVPYLEEAYETEFLIEESHYVVYDKKGNFKEVLFEENYVKTIKKVKETKE